MTSPRKAFRFGHFIMVSCKMVMISLSTKLPQPFWRKIRGTFHPFKYRTLIKYPFSIPVQIRYLVIYYPPFQSWPILLSLLNSKLKSHKWKIQNVELGQKCPAQQDFSKTLEMKTIDVRHNFLLVDFILFSNKKVRVCVELNGKKNKHNRTQP